MIEADVIVLGAGAAGVSAAISLGPETIVLERRENIGGLAGSIKMEGAIFDFGGHSFHTPHPEVRRLVFDALEMTEQKREARCYSHGSMISYPFQKHFRELQNAAVVAECVKGRQESNGNQEAANFEDYLRRQFGPGIAKHFLLPYNRKLWGTDLRRLATDWVNERVAAPEGVAQEFRWQGGERKPLQSDTLVAYPARGGFGEILLALVKRVKKLRLGTRVVRINPAGRELVTADGEVFHWKHLISTIPVNELLKIIDSVPSSLLLDVARLEYLSLKLILVVIDNPVDTDIQRIYTADVHIPAHKIVINHNSSAYLRSLPHHGIMGEVSYSREKVLPQNIEISFLNNLHDLKLINKGSVLKTASLDVKYGFPVPSLDG